MKLAQSRAGPVGMESVPMGWVVRGAVPVSRLGKAVMGRQLSLNCAKNSTKVVATVSAVKLHRPPARLPQLPHPGVLSRTTRSVGHASSASFRGPPTLVGLASYGV